MKHKTIPLEPTKDMVIAGGASLFERGLFPLPDDVVECYKAMLVAAPLTDHVADAGEMVVKNDTQGRLDAMRLAIQGFVDAWIECGCWPDADSEKNAVDQAFNECKKVLTAELKREPVGGDV